MRPLLAIDGDSLAHRAFHALPGSIRDGKGRPANMLVGFANMLTMLWDAEKPRTLFAGFDTLTVPTYRHELLPGYQSGRDFPEELTRQLDLLPELVEALGFAWAKEAGYEADDFLAAAVRDETGRRGRTLVVTSDRDLFQLASESVTLLMPTRGVSELARVGPPRCESATASSRSRYPTSSRFGATHPTGFRAPAASARPRRRRSSPSTAPSTPRSPPGASRRRRTTCGRTCA